MDRNVLFEDTELFAKYFDLCEDLRGKCFLITGATGLIGSVMVKCLLALNRRKNLGIKIIVVVRNKEKAKVVFGTEYEKIDIRQMALADISVGNIASDVNYIIHLASPTASKYFVERPVETLRTSIEGTVAVLEYAKLANIEAMVYTSSLEVYGSNSTDDWIDEQFQGYVNPLEIRSSYNIGKRSAECLCHAYAEEYGVPVKIARMTQTFGAGVEYNDSRVFAQFARKIIERKNIELHSTGETARMYCYTTDAISALLYILIRGKNGEAYNAANTDTYISIRDMAQMLVSAFRPDLKVITDIRLDMGYAPTTKLKLDTSKLQSLGWKPRFTLLKMFHRLIEYYKQLV